MNRRSKLCLWSGVTCCFVMMLGSGCTKSDIDIILDNANGFGTSGTVKDSTGTNGSNTKPDTTNNNTGTAKKTMYFTANVVSMLSRSRASETETAPIGAGRNVTVYTYSSNNLIESKQYTTTVGELNPVDGTQMIVPTGTYSFYAACVNTPTGDAVPVFSSGKASGLKNNIDYVWGSKNSFTPSDNANNVSFTLTHSCTQVIVRLIPATGITVQDVTMAITPSDPTGCIWNLMNGQIAPSTAVLSDTQNMGVTKTDSGTYGQLTMIPLSSSGSLTANFTAKVNSESAARNYTLALPMSLVQNNLAAGSSYIFTVTLNLNNVTFNNVSITNWVYVNVNGNSPIIPSQL